MLEEGNEERNINPTKKQGNFALIFFKEINQHTTADPCRGGHEIAITPYNPKTINNKYSNKLKKKKKKDPRRGKKIKKKRRVTNAKLPISLHTYICILIC